MNRLLKKCFVASTGIHLLLLVILLVGAAFVASPSKPTNVPVLDYVGPTTVDDALQVGGDTHASAQPAAFNTPPTAPPVSAARPESSVPPQSPSQRTPPRDPVKDISPPKDEPKESPEPSTDRKPKKPHFDFTLVTRPTRDAQADARKRAEAEAREQQRESERQVAARQNNLSAEVGIALKDLHSGCSGSTTFDWPSPGSGSVPYANFYQRVKSVYSHAWRVPDGVTDESATVGVSVTIARDGRVMLARITQSSRNPAVDQSVQATLDRVNFAAPLPEGANESQRTVSITFNVAARRALE